MSIKELRKYLNDFQPDLRSGKKDSSFCKRGNKKLFMPRLAERNLGDFLVEEKNDFTEVGNGNEINYAGLRQFVYVQKDGKDIFIFDNHKHAFLFWVYAVRKGKLRAGGTLLHVDQHRDTREPGDYLSSLSALDLNIAFHYTQEDLNGGNLIEPALALNIFADVAYVTKSADFYKRTPEEFTLDLDLDIFAAEMGNISYEYKIRKIKTYMEKANFITIATSPFFMSQREATRIIGELL